MPHSPAPVGVPTSQVHEASRRVRAPDVVAAAGRRQRARGARDADAATQGKAECSVVRNVLEARRRVHEQMTATLRLVGCYYGSIKSLLIFVHALQWCLQL